MPLSEILPNLARLDTLEMALIQAVRVCSPDERDQLYQLALTLALRRVSAEKKSPPGNVVLLADPLRKFR